MESKQSGVKITLPPGACDMPTRITIRFRKYGKLVLIKKIKVLLESVSLGLTLTELLTVKLWIEIHSVLKPLKSKFSSISLIYTCHFLGVQPCQPNCHFYHKSVWQAVYYLSLIHI